MSVYKIKWKSKKRSGTVHYYGKSPSAARKEFYRAKKKGLKWSGKQLPPTARIKSIKKD